MFGLAESIIDHKYDQKIKAYLYLRLSLEVIGVSNYMMALINKAVSVVSRAKFVIRKTI